MTEPILDAARAWRLLRDACTQEWRAGETGELPLPGAAGLSLTIEPGGAWRLPGPVTDEAAWLLDLYLPLCAVPHGRIVMAQMGQSLDGHVATVTGASQYVTGPADLTHLHRLRALCDAVIVGAHTVILDDPQLTVRHVDGRNPVRVILDPSDRVPRSLGVFRDGQAATLCIHDAARCRSEGTEGSPGVEILALPADGDGIAPDAIVAALAARGLRRLLVEGGGQTVSRFLAAGALDRLLVTVAPMIIGSGKPSLRLPEIEHLGQALRPPCRRFFLGDDVLFDFCLR